MKHTHTEREATETHRDGLIEQMQMPSNFKHYEIYSTVQQYLIGLLRMLIMPEK